MKTTIEVQNLKCGGCAKTITNKLTGLKNINEVAIDVDASLISFQYDNAEDAILGRTNIENTWVPFSRRRQYIDFKSKIIR